MSTAHDHGGYATKDDIRIVCNKIDSLFCKLDNKIDTLEIHMNQRFNEVYSRFNEMEAKLNMLSLKVWLFCAAGIFIASIIVPIISFVIQNKLGING